jgi:hypothetical protein
VFPPILPFILERIHTTWNGTSKASTGLINTFSSKDLPVNIYAETLAILKKSEAGLLNSRAKEAAKAEQVLSTSYNIDCGPSGKVICPVCKGTTVIIKKGYINDEYKTCQFCDKHGNLTCDEYNSLIRGELKPKNQ